MPGSSPIGVRSLLLGTERAQVENAAIDLNLRAKPVALLKRAFEPIAPTPRRVARVLASGTLTKIGNAVVRAIAVDMINLPIRVVPEDVKPRQTVSHVGPSCDDDRCVAGA